MTPSERLKRERVSSALAALRTHRDHLDAAITALQECQQSRVLVMPLRSAADLAGLAVEVSAAGDVVA